MIKNILDDVDNELSKTINALIGEFDGIRVGRVSAMQVENILIEYYGALTQLKSLATITVSSARSLQISPYDKSQIKTIEKVLMDDPEIDGNVSSDGNIIFINFPEITTEKRNMFAKIAKTKAENAKVSARNVRHNSYHRLKEFDK
jgi:ribosome recycling factor